MKTYTHGKIYKSNYDCGFKFADENFNESCLENVRVEKQEEYDDDGEENAYILYPEKERIYNK